MEDLFSSIRHGSFERVQQIVSAEPSLVDVADDTGRTAVTVAIESRNIGAVKLFVEKNCRLSKWLAFNYESNEPQTQSQDTHGNAKKEMEDIIKNTNDNTLLPRQDFAGVDSAEVRPTPKIHKGVEVKSRYEDAEVCLANGQATPVYLHNGKVDKTDYWLLNTNLFYPPLLAAVTVNSLEMLKIILETRRAFVDEAYKNTTPLLQACIKGYTDIVAVLIKYGADVNGQSAVNSLTEEAQWYYKPLYQAVQHNHSDIIEILVESGAQYLQVVPLDTSSFHAADPASVSHRGLATLLELAVRRCQPTVVSSLIDIFRSDITDMSRYYSLMWSIKLHLTDMTQLLIDKLFPDAYCMEADECHEQYCQTLRVAVRECPQNDETVPLLLLKRFGARLFWKEESFFIILHSAVIRCLPQLVTRLVEIMKEPQCQFDVAAYESWPDICSAALYYGNKQILTALYEQGLLDFSDHCNGENAFFEAIFCGRHGSSVYDILSWLVDLGLDPACCDNNKMQPIHAAVTYRLNSAVDALCRLGVDANARMGTDDLPTCLHLHLNLRVLQLGCDLNLELINILISHGADLAAENRKGYTPVSILFWLLHANIMQGEANSRAAGSDVEGQSHNNTNSTQPSLISAPNFAVSLSVDQTSVACPQPLSVGSIEEGPIKTENEAQTLDVNGAVVPQNDFQPSDSTRHSSGQIKHNLSLAEPPSQQGEILTGLSMQNNADALPSFLRLGSPWRSLTESLVNKFGVELFAMGAARLTGPEHWRKVYFCLLEAGIDMGHLPTLRALCWLNVRQSMGSVRFNERVTQLPVPSIIKTYLTSL